MLSRSKFVNKFDNRENKFIIHVIYFTLIVQNHSKIIIFMFIIKIEIHSLILSKFWINVHENILNMKNDKIIFKFDRCFISRFLEFWKLKTNVQSQIEKYIFFHQYRRSNFRYRWVFKSIKSFKNDQRQLYLKLNLFFLSSKISRMKRNSLSKAHWNSILDMLLRKLIKNIFSSNSLKKNDQLKLYEIFSNLHSWKFLFENRT